MRLRVWGPYILISLLLAYLTLSAIGLLNRSPDHRTLGAIADALATPGALVASVFYPEGIHTGRGSIGSFYVTIVANLLVYAVVWFFLLRIFGRIARRRQTIEPRKKP